MTRWLIALSACVMDLLFGSYQIEMARAEETTDTVLDPAPIATARAHAMGGALSTLADDVDAIYYNPSGIGRSGSSGKSGTAPFTRGLFFPYAAVSMNSNARAIYSEFEAKQAQSNAPAGAAILDANAGKRQFARASFVPMGFLLGRTAIVPLIDHQLAAVPQLDSPGQVKMRYRTYSGALMGASISDAGNRLAIGYSQSYGSIQDTTGTFNYLDFADVETRNQILKQGRKTYTASASNAGLTIRIPRALNPSFSVVARNIGNTKNKASESGGEPLVFDEDLTAGVSISPPLGKFGRFNILVEGGNLSQKHLSGSRKIRGGLECLIGGDHSKSLLGIRAGGNHAGTSFGANLNLGIIGVEAESHAVDIGTNNNRVIERRSSAVVYVNIADF